VPELPTSLREQLQTLLPDEGSTITADEVMASVEVSRVEGPRQSEPIPVTPRRRVTGLAPALAWMLGILVLAAMGVGIFVGVNGTSASKPVSVGAIGKLSDRLVLNKTQVIAGHNVYGSLIIQNPGDTFTVVVGCQPLQVLLNRGNFHQQPSSTEEECIDHLGIRHGITRLAITINTVYDNCHQSETVSPNSSRQCAASGPPLPRGTYLAKVEWGGPMPLPTPNEVALTLVGKTATSVGPPVTTPLSACTTKSLHTVVQGTEGSAEHWVIFLTFINISNASCTMIGSPHVAFLDDSGNQVGLPAQNGGAGTKVILTPGSGAQSGIWEWESQVANPDGFRCSPAHAAALRVEPPGETSAVVIKGTGRAWSEAMDMCSNLAAQADPVTLS
jgi:hypothetical protein